MAESYAVVQDAVVVGPGAGRSGGTRAEGPLAAAQFAPMGDDEVMDDRPVITRSPSGSMMKISETPTAATPDVDSVNGTMNGNHGGVIDLDDDLNNEELTPPPDTPVSPSPESDDRIDEPASRTPSLPVDTLGDEIVVGTKPKPVQLQRSPLNAALDLDDVDMDDAEDDPMISQKRKRTSTFVNLAEDDVVSPAPRTELPDARPRLVRPLKADKTSNVKGTLLGYWRDSEAVDPKDKHSVIGFIDIRDRLRTRIQNTNRDGVNISDRYPLPPGPGGSWVTFQQVAFDSHLVYLNQHQVKEYVKIRVENQRSDETPEERIKANEQAVKEAIRRLEENPPPAGATDPLVAYGPDIPDSAQPQSRPEAKKRRLNTVNSISAGVSPAPLVPLVPLPDIRGTRPTRILIGYWKLSSEVDPKDKHAVFGILGQNDMFRVKLTKETRDGRPLSGNFPQGAGALWIHWEDVEFENHLRTLTRPEIKEYCRVRQRQLDDGETPEERVSNETKAVYEAQSRVAHNAQFGPPDTGPNYRNGHVPIRKPPMAIPALAMKPPVSNGSAYHAVDDNPAGHDDTYVPPMPRRADSVPRARHSLPDVELRAANRQPPAPSALERTNSIARRELAQIEKVTMRAEQRNLDRESYSNQVQVHAQAQAQAQAQAHAQAQAQAQNQNRNQFQDNISRLNNVWAMQEANRLKVGAEDAKIYMGVKYERKTNGPFEGKLVSQGTIISIDGEDYVEYRVLTKPSFF